MRGSSVRKRRPSARRQSHPSPKGQPSISKEEVLDLRAFPLTCPWRQTRQRFKDGRLKSCIDHTFDLSDERNIGFDTWGET